MFNFIRFKHIPLTISAVVFAGSVAALIVFGLKPSIDFTGGSLIDVGFSGPRPSVPAVQEALAPLNLGTVVAQPAGDDGIILKLRYISPEEHEKILTVLRQAFPGEEKQLEGVAIGVNGATAEATATVGTPSVVERRIETIGPSISATLRERAWKVGLAVIIAIISFIAYAFRKVSKPVASWRYGVVAVLALLHTVIITAGVFAFLGKYQGVEVDIPFLVGLLTVFGYSVNDTIVIFDRIRENLLRHRGEPFHDVVNRGINETYGRSITNSITVLLVLFAMFLFGGETIHYFCLTLIIGIAVGTYASIFVATGLLVIWQDWQERSTTA